jgi:hypothetical protein
VDLCTAGSAALLAGIGGRLAEEAEDGDRADDANHNDTDDDANDQSTGSFGGLVEGAAINIAAARAGATVWFKAGVGAVIGVSTSDAGFCGDGRQESHRQGGQKWEVLLNLHVD